MGNYKFRLSDMLPNAWFYKLRDMSKTRNNTTQTPNSLHHHHHTSNINNKFSLTTFDPPRKSLKKKWARRRTAVYVPSDPRKITPSLLHDTDDDDLQFQAPDGSPTSNLDQGFLDPGHLSGSFQGPGSSSATDIINNVDDPVLPPILTRPKIPNSKVENENRSSSKPADNEHSVMLKKTRSPARISVSRPGRVRIRKSRKRHVKEEKKDEEVVRFAIVKASLDPEKDFRESMMEMIVEKKMKESKELEELLACYLSLNSDQYHDVIIRAFQHIWLNLDQ